MSLMLVRMFTGEDIVAEIIENEDTITLENPAVLMPMREDANGKVAMGFGPWVPFAADSKVKVNIHKDKVLFMVEPNKELSNSYRQVYGSGIVVPEISTKEVLT